MDCRAAAWEDLPQLRRMYLAIVDEMQKNGLSIWDEVYPCVALEDDIHRRRLYCIPGGPDGIAAAFALSPAHNGERHVLWPWPDARAVYLDRLGVDPPLRPQRLWLRSSALRLSAGTPRRCAGPAPVCGRKQRSCCPLISELWFSAGHGYL